MKKNLYLITAILLTLPAVCQAEDFYIGFGQSGDGSHTSCITAASYLFYNNNANCGAGDGKISVGDTVYLCDDTGPFESALITPIGCNEFSVLPAPGEYPDISVSTVDDALSFPNAGKKNITVGPGITFSNWGDAKKAIYFFNPIGPLTVTGNTFSKDDATSTSTDAVRIAYANASADLTDVEISDNAFNLNQYASAFVINITTSSGAYRVHDVDFVRNTGTTVNFGFRFLNATGAAYTLPQGLIPYNIRNDDNYFQKTYSSYYATVAGITEIDGESTVLRNTIDECGDVTTPLVNCFQMHYSTGTSIQYNKVYGTFTSECDGRTVILDWVASNDAYISSNNDVRFNEFYNSISECGGGCVSAFKSSGDLIDYNLCDGATEAAFKIGSNESTDITLSHNTALNTPVCFKLADGDNIGVTGASITDSICDSPTSKDVEVLNNSTDPTTARNFFYNAPASDITLDATDSAADPKLTATGRLKESSPARGACPSTTHFGSDCGAYTTQAGLLMPWNPALNISYNHGVIGPGQERPVTPDYLFFGSDQIFFGADALHF